MEEWQENALADALLCTIQAHNAEWTESVAVGGRGFVESVQNELGIAGRHRRIAAAESDGYNLREAESCYISNVDTRIGILRTENMLLWKLGC